MYSFDARVRFSEVGADDRISMAGIVNYLQDCSTFQSEDLYLGMKYLRERGIVWVINSWQIDVSRFPELGDRITVATSPYALKGFLGYRNFWIADERGEKIVRANSIWSLITTDTFRPCEITEEMLERYELDPKLEMEYLPRKIKVPEGGKHFAPLKVEPCHLDPNRHMNNGQYVTLAMGYLPEDFHPAHLRTEYRQQAFLGAVLHPYLVTVEDAVILSWNDDEGKPYAIVEFRP